MPKREVDLSRMGMAKLRGCCCLLHATTMVCIFFQSKLKWGCMSLREAPAVLIYSSTFFSTTKSINDKTWSKTNAKQSFCGRQEQKLRFGTFTGFNGFNSKLQVETYPSRQESCAMRSLSLSLCWKKVFPLWIGQLVPTQDSWSMLSRLEPFGSQTGGMVHE